MRQRSHRASFLAAVVLLLATSTAASAECAWVLWSTTYRMSTGSVVGDTTIPLTAFTSKAECEQGVNAREAREEQRKKTDPSIERYFVCLPDTIDARGPKSK
jgi:hypothetical protein